MRLISFFVNVRNQEDMKSIYTHFKVGVNIFKDVSDYARNDENPSEAEVPCSDKEYWELYEERKALLKKLCCNDSKQIADYCDWVMEKESKTLYYLTDATSLG